MYCTNCGKEVREDARFCPYCGQEIKWITADKQDAAANMINALPPEGQSSAAQAAAVPTGKNTKKRIATGITVIAVIAICCIGVPAWQYFHRPATLLFKGSNNTGRLVYSIKHNGEPVDTDWNLDEKTGQTSVVIPAGHTKFRVDYIGDDQEEDTCLIDLWFDAEPGSVVDVADLMPACIGGIDYDTWSFTSKPSYTAAALASLDGYGFPPYWNELFTAYMAGGKNADLLPSYVSEEEKIGDNLYQSHTVSDFRYSTDPDGNMIVYTFNGSDLSAVQAIKDGQTLWGERYAADKKKWLYIEYDDAGNETAYYHYDRDTGETDGYTLRTYDTNGNLLKEEEALGSHIYVTEYSYDEKGNLLQKDRTWGDHVSTCQYEPEYDSAGHLIHLVGRSEGEVTEEYFYTYDDDGNLIEREFDDCSDPEYRKCTVWDGDGRVLSATGHDGFTYTFSYNADGDCILANWQNGSTTATSKIDYLNGHPLCSYVEFATTDDPERDHDQPELYYYDGNGRLEYYKKFLHEEPLRYHIRYEKAETLQQNEDPRPNT